MKKIITLAVVAAACSTSAFAQVSNFTGFSAAANLTSIKTDTTPQGEAALSGRGTGANLQAAYGFDLTPEYVLAVGATFGLTSNKAGGYVDTNETGDLKLKKQVSIYVEPGYLVSPQTLVYGKVSYESATDEVTSSVPANNDSADIKGVGLGFGVRTMIDKNWFAQAEYKQTKFDKKMSNAGTNLDVKNSGVSIGIWS
jgi:opacity protein-like surface antigen